MTKRVYRSISQILVLIVAVKVQAIAADKQRIQPVVDTSQEIIQLKLQLADQQRQIGELRASLQELIHRNQQTASSGTEQATELQRSSPVISQLGRVYSPASVVPATAPVALPVSVSVASQKSEIEASPLQLHVGSATVTPIGFMDFTAVYRSTNPGSGVATNFGSIPFSNSVNGNISEFRLSAQNSRVGFRVDTNVRGAHVLGYFESDFLGFVPGNAAVTSNSDGLRLRLYWVDVRKDKLELFGGQSWSMLTANRRGLSALPSDLFYSQDIDANYQNGLVWSRNPQFRFIVHPSEKFAAGISLENPEQYIGGSGGGGMVTIPSMLATAYGNQLNNGNTGFLAPNVHPDIVAKIAFDPSIRTHLEIAGLFRTFRVYNPLDGEHHSASGVGGSVNFNVALTKNFRIFSNNYYSDGGGRWIFGLAPDLIVRPDGSLSPLHSGSTVDGFELQNGHMLLYAYYGGVWITRSGALDFAGKTAAPVGYGYAGSPDSQNRTIQEPTFGITKRCGETRDMAQCRLWRSIPL